MYTKQIEISGINNGYSYFIDYNHPLATGNSGRVYLHRHIASILLGHWLCSDEHVHHIDGIRTNNDEDNLLVLSAEEHAELHKGRIDRKNCIVCGKTFKPGLGSAKFCSRKCSSGSQVKDTNITKELLNELIPHNSWVSLGKLFGYSDTGIKKRAVALGCTIK